MNIQDFIIEEDTPVIKGMKVIQNGGKAIAFVCKNNKLVAAVSDGDVRRYILADGNLESPIKNLANYSPIFLYEKEANKAQELMRENQVLAIPILDNNNYIVNIEFLFNEINEVKANLNIPLVIMAGGKGTRLKPYTDILPKPLIPIAGVTITEHIINKFEKYSCNSIYMIVNYMKNFIKSYFQEKELRYNINFIDETRFLGTGGGLKLLKGKITETFFMTNCDTLVETDYAKLLAYHKECNNIITMVCAEKEMIIPYGTVEIQNGMITKLNEKPKLRHNVNTGFYIIEPEFLEFIPDNQFIHITDIIMSCMKKGKRAGVYLIDENNWMDMGQIEELEKMKEKMELL